MFYIPMHELILASSSPRRKQILLERGFEFRTFPLEVSEILDKNLNIPERICQVARQKAEAVAQQLKPLESQEIVVLAADTVVVLDQDLLGKPQGREDAIQTLVRLSGRSHQVITGYAILTLPEGRLILSHETSEVIFRKLTLAEIQAYVDTGEPMDKAGSYAIQGEGGQFVVSHSGSFANIVGLPIEAIEKVFLEHGWNFRKKLA